MSKRIALVAGEASGDLLGAHLIAALRQRVPDLQCFGIGGPRMVREGFQSIESYERLAVNGIPDALARVPELLGVRRRLLDHIKAQQADVFVGIDAPDFNLGVERRLKRAGIPTVHYVSPTIWAWRGGRIKTIRRAADHVLCLFPFEPALYHNKGVGASFVGHPLADEFPMQPDRFAVRERLNLSPTAPIVTLMPGSRVGEVSRLAGVFVEAARRIREQVPDTRFLVPLLTRETRLLFESALVSAGLEAEFPMTLMVGHSHDAMIASDVVLLASGTAALEAALLKRPMVVAYRMASWAFKLIKRMAYLPYVGLPNILSGEFVVPELLQDDCTPEKLAEAVVRWLRDPDACTALAQRFEAMHRQLQQDCGRRAAEVILPMLSGQRR